MFRFSRNLWLIERSKAIDDLPLAHLWVIYPGDEAYELDDSISVVPVTQIPTLARQLVA